MSVLGNTITAADYNAIVGYNPTTNLDTFNAVWGVGSGKFGYGQPALPNVDNPAVTLTDGIIRSDKWVNLVNAISLSGLHQGTSIIQIQNTPLMPNQGALIQAEVYNRAKNSIVDLYAKHLNAAAQGTSANYPAVNSSIWRDTVTFTHTVTFANGESARYFFNCGGQLALTFASPPGIKINALMAALGQNAGTVVISSPNIETIKIANTNYKGVTKIGGAAPASLDPRYTTERYGVQAFNEMISTCGYYGMSTSYQDIFKQSVGGFPSSAPRYHYYDGSYILVRAKSNGPQGTFGDNGNIITITTTWDQVPNGLQVTAGTTTTLTVRPPFLRNGMTKSWTDPVVSVAVSGS
jgi:hypothetical protein